MPKDWDRHKTEIERLYMVERLTLKDVRNIMKTRFTFDASIRAYRMKLDEWQFWKNNSKNDRRAKKTRSRRHRLQPAVEVSDSEDPDSSAVARVTESPPLVNVSIPTSDFDHSYENLTPDISETLCHIASLHFTPERGLEHILKGWKSDGTYLEGALSYLDANRSRFQIHYTTLQGTTIFQEILAKLLFDEALTLAKLCLEIDFEQAQKPNIRNKEWDVHPNWMKIWRVACASRHWQEIVKYVHTIGLEPGGPGLLFTRTAIPFLAEKMLQQNLEQLERWDPGVHQFDACLQEFMLILSSFIKANMFDDVDKIWYKRFLQFKLTHISQMGDTGHWGQLEEYRRKFLQLKTLHESINQSKDPMQNLLNVATVLKECKAILNATPTTGTLTESRLPTLSTTPTASQPESLSKASSAVQTLLKKTYKKWSWGKVIQDDIEDIMDHLIDFGISDPLWVEENPFILISRTLPPRDQVCFTAAILAGVNTSFPMFEWDELMAWSSWLRVHKLRSLAKLQTTIDLPELFKFYLNDEIGPVTVKLVLSAFTVFAGDITLSNLKHTILHQTSTRSMDYIESRFDYMKILDQLQARKLPVDQEWTRFLGIMLSWELNSVVNSSMLESSGDVPRSLKLST